MKRILFSLLVVTLPLGGVLVLERPSHLEGVFTFDLAQAGRE